MIRCIGILVLGTAAAFVVFFLPMSFLVKEAPPEVVVWAALICLIPGAAVLVLSQRLSQRDGAARIVGVLLSTALRMAGSLGGGLWEIVPTLPPIP